MLFWKVPAPNEALVISGSKHKDPGGPQFRIITGHGCFVVPVKQKARYMSLDLREASISEPCVTKQGIPLLVQAVVVFKVGDDESSIANAARRFLDQQDLMESLAGRVFSGHLRSIVGGLTVEEIIRERDRLTQEVKASSASEMEKLGLVVDSLQIQEITDETGYIKSLAAPHIAVVQKDARVAQAQAEQEATEREQESEARKAEYVRQARIAQAGYQAEVDTAQAEASQAGPLAQAAAEQRTIAEQTKRAVLEADLAAKRLEGTVRRPADAEAYRQRTLAQAEADAMRLRADSLKEGNQQLLASNRVVDQLPDLVTAAASGLSGSNLTVLNGADGISEMLTGLIGQGMAILDALQRAAPGRTAQAGRPSSGTASAGPGTGTDGVMARVEETGA